MAKSKLATPEARSNSSYQKQINRLENILSMNLRVMSYRKRMTMQSNKFISYLLEEGRTSKEELSRFFFKLEK